MIQYFKNQRINSQWWLLLILLVLLCNQAIAQLLQGHILSFVSIKFSYVSILTSAIIIFISAALLNNVSNRFHLLDSPSYLPALLLIVLSAFLPNVLNIAPWMASLVLLILIFNKLYKAYQKNKPEPNYFDSSFLLGIITILIPQTIVLLIPLLLSIFIISIPKFKYFILSIIGFVIPFAFYVTGLKVTNQLDWYAIFSAIEFDVHSLTTLNIKQIIPHMYGLLSVGVICILFWISRRHLLNNIQYPMLRIASIFFITGICIMLLYLSAQLDVISVIILPLAILLSYLFYWMNKKLANLLFILLIGFALVIPWITQLKQFL